MAWQKESDQFSKIEACFFLLAFWCFFLFSCSQNFRSLTWRMRWLGFHPFLRCKIKCPWLSRLYATLESELYPQLLQRRTFSSKMRYFFQHRQHSQMNLRILLILLPSSESSLMPICTATFCRAKSALISQMLKPCSSWSSSLKLDMTSAIFFSQFLLVIHPYSSSDSLEEEETLRLGLTGTDIHPSSSYPCSTFSAGFSPQVCSSCPFWAGSGAYYYSSSSLSEKGSRLLSCRYSSRSFFSKMGGGSLLSIPSNPSFLQSAYATAINSISTSDSEAISPVFLANSFTNSIIFSSGSTTSISKGRLYTNSLVLASLNSLRTSAVVTRRVVVARLLMLLMEMKALASRMAIDLRVVYIVDNGKIRILSGRAIQGGGHLEIWTNSRKSPMTISIQGRRFYLMWLSINLFNLQSKVAEEGVALLANLPWRAVWYRLTSANFSCLLGALRVTSLSKNLS